MSRHSPGYPKEVISLQVRVAAYARNWHETPSDENLAVYVEHKRKYLAAKAEHHITLARLFKEASDTIDGSELKEKK